MEKIPTEQPNRRTTKHRTNFQYEPTEKLKHRRFRDGSQGQLVAKAIMAYPGPKSLVTIANLVLAKGGYQKKEKISLDTSVLHHLRRFAADGEVTRSRS